MALELSRRSKSWMDLVSLNMKTLWMHEMSFQVSLFEKLDVVLISDSFPYVSFILLLIGFSPLPDGSELKGERLTVQFARGPRKRDDYAPQERQAPRPRRTVYRLQITGLAPDTSWQVRTLNLEKRAGIDRSRIWKILLAQPDNWMLFIQRPDGTMAKGRYVKRMNWGWHV